MKLIKELTEEVEYITEATQEDGSKNYTIKGIIMQGDVTNRNGRIYPSRVLAKETARYNKEFVERNRAFGELGHPQGPTVNPDRVSHMFKLLEQDGSNIVGSAKIMDTPMGKIVKNFIDEGAQLGISSRGMGSIKENRNGVLEIQDDFTLATAGDIVTDPSGPNCFIEGIMEGVEFFFDEKNGIWTQHKADIISEAEEKIKKTGAESRALLESKSLHLFQNLLNALQKQ